MKKRTNIHVDFLIALSVLAIVISSYLLYLHYVDTSSFCDISPSLSCDIVNKSRYSEFPPGSGIPVSGLGLLMFVSILICLILIRNNKKFVLLDEEIDQKFLINLLFYISVFNIIFALYLIYTEMFLILSFCILCLVLDAIILIMLLFLYKLRGRK